MAKILAFSGSNSSKSINQKLVTVAAHKIKGHDVTVISLIDFPMPLFSEDLEAQEGEPLNAAKLKALWDDADGFIISCPEHNGSMPAAFKNTIDWISRNGPNWFGKKPMLLMTTSGGANGGGSCLETLQKLMPWWGGDIKASASFGKFHDIYNDGKLDEENDAKLDGLLKDFLDAF